MGTLMPRNRHQALRLRRALLATGTGAAHTLICYLAYVLGYFQLSLSNFIVLFAVIWTGHLFFPLFIRSGWNRLLRDPSLTFPQIGWFILVNSITLYFCDPALRYMMLMFYLVIALFGAFRLGLKGFVMVALFTLGCYAVVLRTLYINGATLQWGQEVLAMLLFMFMLLGACLLGYELSELHATLKRRNIELNQAMQQIRELAITDELTGLYNRRHLMTILRRQKGLADRGNYQFAICFLDLDYFKRINDRFGHHIGDVALQDFGDVIRDAIRDVDFVVRYGGEEFVLVLVRTDLEQAQQAVERIRWRIEQHDFSTVAEGLKLTASIGVTEYWPGEGLKETLKRADTAAYNAKQRGRNQVVIATQDNPEGEMEMPLLTQDLA